MAVKTTLSGPVITMEIKSDVGGVPANCDEMINILRQLRVLNDVVPMAVYSIERVGSTCTWEVTASAKDGRSYSTTVTFPDGPERYTLTSFAEGTGEEVQAFLALIMLFAKILRMHEIKSIAIGWA